MVLRHDDIQVLVLPDRNGCQTVVGIRAAGVEPGLISAALVDVAQTRPPIWPVALRRNPRAALRYL